MKRPVEGPTKLLSAGFEGETRALSSIITNWTVPNPGNGQTGETIRMLVTIDGSLDYERVGTPPVLVGSRGQGRLSSPGAVQVRLNGR